MRHIRFAILLVSLAVASGLKAAEADSVITLDRCIELALANNMAVRNAANDTKAAVELRREAFTKYFPEVSATGTAFWTHNDIFQYNLLDIIEIGFINKGKMAGVQAMQPLFMGGQIVNGNKLAAVGEEVARLRQQQTLDELRLTTESLYWKLVTLKASRGALEAAIATLDTLDTQVKVAVDAGVAMRNDLLKVQLKRNTYRSEMVDLDNGIKLVRMLLGQYMGKGADWNFDVDDAVPEAVPAFPAELYMPGADALPLTTDYKLLQKNVEAKKLEKRIEIGRNLPQVALGAGWFYHDLLEQNHNFGALMVAVNIPLSGWWGGSHAIKRKSLALENARNELTDLGEKLEIGMQDKWNSLTAAHRKMDIACEGVGESSENLRLNRLYYEAGMSTVTDVLEAEASHKESIDSYIAAYGAFCVARSAYLIATGRTAAGSDSGDL